jgi:hypothetical protein
MTPPMFSIQKWVGGYIYMDLTLTAVKVECR